jgi:hypothetical protein
VRAAYRIGIVFRSIPSLAAAEMKEQQISDSINELLR